MPNAGEKINAISCFQTMNREIESSLKPIYSVSPYTMKTAIPWLNMKKAMDADFWTSKLKILNTVLRQK